MSPFLRLYHKFNRIRLSRKSPRQQYAARQIKRKRVIFNAKFQRMLSGGKAYTPEEFADYLRHRRAERESAQKEDDSSEVKDVT